MFLEVWFWLLVALVLLPLPFKLIQYATGRDASPTIVKVEEVTNAIFLSLGLIAFYGFNRNEQFLTPDVWLAWLLISILVSVLSLLWSPKLKYATTVLGQRHTRAMMATGVLMYLPMYYAVYRYATET